MYGFEAISNHNGWAMALAGALIVFSGLVILSTVISQLHKVLGLFEGRTKRINKNGETQTIQAAPASSKQDKDYRFPDNLKQVLVDFKAASEPLGEHFQLTELYLLAGEMDDPHPHLTISYLRQHQYLMPTGEGLFAWR